jgi:hypothetical protein
MQASEAGSTVKYKLNCTAWPEPYAEVLLETDSEGLLKILAATEIRVSKRLLGISCWPKRIGPVLRPSCAQMLSSVEKQADRRRSSLSKRR